MTSGEYEDEITSIAKGIIEEHGLNEDDWHDAVHESVDGHQWIIYTGFHEEILDNSDNEPDNDEVTGMADPKGGWRDFRQVAAFMAMEADVQQKLRELADEYFECEDCSETCKIEDQGEYDYADLCVTCAQTRIDEEKEEEIQNLFDVLDEGGTVTREEVKIWMRQNLEGTSSIVVEEEGQEEKTYEATLKGLREALG